MTYWEFNKRAFDYYISKGCSTFFSLSLDEQEFQSLIGVEEIANFDFLKFSWDNLNGINGEIPSYFGLIAIQCYAASLMHNDGVNAEDNYKIRLSKLLGLKNVSFLNALFIGRDSRYPIQETIWYNAKLYLENNFSQKIDIPIRRNNAGRYVQYPKSQALLNTEDLRYFTKFFSEEFHLNETIPFHYFNERLNIRLPFLKISNRARRLLEDKEKSIGCYQQIYNYYSTWDGNVYSFGIRSYSLIAKNTMTESKKILLLFTNSELQFYVIDENTGNFNKVVNEELFKIDGYRYFYKGLIVFTETGDMNEYEDSRFLYKNKQHYILVDRNIKPTIDEFLNKNNFPKTHLSSNVTIYKYFLYNNVLENSSVLNSLIYAICPVYFKGGLKVSRKNEYLKGYGPLIVYDKKFEVIFNNRKYEYMPDLAEKGLYKVRTNNFRDIEFCILELEEETPKIESRFKGWNLQRYFIDESFNIEGCLVNREIRKSKSIFREWIEFNLGNKRKHKCYGNNILIHALNNSKK